MKNGSSEHQVYSIHKVLRISVNFAVKLGYIGRNPCKGTTPPRPDHQEMRFYDDQQVQAMLDAAREIYDRLYPLYYLAVHTAASLMLNHGIPILIASRRLGHSKASITLDIYGHLMPNKQEEAAELLDRLMNPA